jgi:hypothetical protein
MKHLTSVVVAVMGLASVVPSAQDQPSRPARPEGPARPAAPAPVAPLAPLEQVAPAPPVPLSGDEGRQSWTFVTGGWTRVHVETRGRVELADDEHDVTSVSPNGSFEMSAKGWLSLFGHRYVVRGNADGTTTRRFSVGNAERPLDAQARAWIADTIQQLVRNGFGAEARVALLLAQHGPAGVLDEISRLDRDATKATYFTLLFREPRLDRPTADRVLRQVGREVGSDFERARVLIAFAEAFPLDDAVAPTFVDVTNGIGSDFEHARVLMTVIAPERPTPAAVKTVLASTPRMGSDFEKARVLIALTQKHDLGADAVLGIVRATTAFGSDFEHSRVLLELIGAQPIDPATRQAVLDATRGMGSAYERGRVMTAMLQETALR